MEGFWENVLSGIVANVAWFCITASIAAVYLLRKDRSKFSGQWKSQIRWNTDWAREMLVGPHCRDPQSEGEISLSYGSGAKRNQYWGLSFWMLQEGTETLAKLCVELWGLELVRKGATTFPYFAYTLTRARLRSKFRHPIKPFDYPAPFANYEIAFSKATKDFIEGRVHARRHSESSPIDVGSFTAQRVN